MAKIIDRDRHCGYFKNSRWYILPTLCVGLERPSRSTYLFFEIYFLNQVLWLELKIWGGE